MKKRVLSALLCAAIVLGVLPVMEIPAKAASKSCDTIKSELLAYYNLVTNNDTQSAYWNIGASESTLIENKNNPQAVISSNPCASSNLSNGNCTSNWFSTEIYGNGTDAQCSAFCSYIAYLIFGYSTYDVRSGRDTTYYSGAYYTKSSSFPETFLPGDIIRYYHYDYSGDDTNTRYNGHTSIVIEDYGDSILVLDCNWDNHCGIRKQPVSKSYIYNSGVDSYGREKKFHYVITPNTNLRESASAVPAPGAPTNFNATWAESGWKANLSWTPSEGATSYEVQYKTPSTGYEWRNDGDYDGNNPYPTSGLKDYASYEFQIRAKNSGGYSDWVGLTFYKTVSVSLNANGGSVSPASVSYTYNSDSGIPATYSGLPVPTWSGHSFLGWYTAASGGTAVTESTKVLATQNHTLYAHWSEIQQYTVTYIANGGGGTMEGSTVSAGTQITLPSNTFISAEGEGFKCWEIGGTEYAPGAKYTVNSNTYIRALWQNIPYPSNLWINVSKSQIVVGDSITFTFGADNAKAYQLNIKRDGAWTDDGTTSYSETTYTKTFSKSGSYEAYLTAINRGDYGGTATTLDYGPVPFTVLPKYAVTVTNGTGGGSYAAGASVTVTANAPESGKQFKEWTGADGLTFTSGSATTSSATFTMPAEAVTVTATYEDAPAPYTPGGNGGNSSHSSGSSGGSSTPASPTLTVPVSGNSGSVSVSATVSGTTANVARGGNLNAVIGTSVKTGNVEIDLSGLSRDISAATIPTDTVKAIEQAVADPKNDASGLTVSLTDGSVMFDKKALATIVEQAKGSDVYLALDRIETNRLRYAQQDAIKGMDVQQSYDIYVTSDGNAIRDFKGGKAVLTVRYTLKSGQTADGIAVWYVSDDGKTLTELPASYDKNAVTFTAEHFSNYVITYDANRKAGTTPNAACKQDSTCPISKFTDADAKAWYHDGVHYALEKGLMNGVGDGKFDPDGTASRATVATMLWRMEGSPAYAGMIEFADVDAESWYTPAVRWAYSEGIITGYEDETGRLVFAPDAVVTREQLATMLYRYAQSKGQGFTGAWMFLLDYPDAASVSEWADEAMHWMVMQGVINGIDGALVPQGSATRAQIATMFMRYAELTNQ